MCPVLVYSAWRGPDGADRRGSEIHDLIREPLKVQVAFYVRDTMSSMAGVPAFLPPRTSKDGHCPEIKQKLAESTCTAHEEQTHIPATGHCGPCRVRMVPLDFMRVLGERSKL